jgi:hypothetical protein
MWARYADQHQGMALGFDVSSNQVRTVTYVETPVTINTSNELIESVRDEKRRTPSLEAELSRCLIKKIATKQFGWRYEQEVRTLLNLQNEEGGRFFTDFDEDLCLREVILGARCEEKEEDVRSLVATFSRGVIVSRAKLHVGKQSQ